MTLPPSNPFGDHAEFPARLAEVPAAAAFVQDFCDRNGVGPDDALRVTLVVEELFSNTVRHGHGDDTDQPIRIALALRDGRVALLYEDTAPRFDPLTRMSTPPASLADPLETRPVGGLGVHLIGQLVAEARYAYEEGSNRIWLTMARPA